MTATLDRTQRIEELRQRMEELCEPELTLGQAEVLRSSVARLLEELRESEGSPSYQNPSGHRIHQILL